jgi:FSR family fosmidomycin resistance protein-like MFS transporter
MPLFYPPAMTPANKRMLTSIGVYHTCNDGALSTLPAMYPILKEELDLVYTDIGFIISAGLLTTLIFQLVIGKISDKHHPKYLLASGLSIITFALFIMILITSYIELLFVILIIRLGASFYHPIGISWISKNFEGKDLDHSMGLQSSFGDTGVFLGFMTTGFIAAQFGWQYPFILWGTLTLLSIIFGLVYVKDKYLEPGSSQAAAPFNFNTIKNLLNRIKYYFLPFAMSGASYTIGISYGPLLLTDKIHLSESLVGLIIGSWIGIGIFTAYSFSKISSALGGRYNTLIISYSTIAAMGLIIGWFTNIFILVIGFLLFGAVLFIIYPALFTITTVITEKNSRGVVFGVLFAAHLSGGVIVGYLCGWLADNFGISVPFYVLFILATVTVLWLIGIRNITNKLNNNLNN